MPWPRDGSPEQSRGVLVKGRRIATSGMRFGSSCIDRCRGELEVPWAGDRRDAVADAWECIQELPLRGRHKYIKEDDPSRAAARWGGVGDLGIKGAASLAMFG